MTTRWDVTKAVRASDLPSPARLIMLVLADVAEVGTAEIPEKFTPSLTVLSRETGLARSTVANRLAFLEASGWITRIRPATVDALVRGERTRYQLSIPETSPADDLVREEGQPSTEDGLDLVREPDLPSPPAGHKNRSSYQTQIRDRSVKRARAPKGTRVSEDFAATPEMIEWARQNTPLVGAKETAAFVDYWLAVPGARGVKLNWLATWRNWMRRAQSDAENKRARASPNGRKPDVLDDPGVRAAYDELFPTRKDGAA